jgi:hypothetical protein
MTKKTTVTAAIDAILTATDTLISNARPKANSANDRGARLARAEREIAGALSDRRTAMNRSAKLAEAERSVSQQATGSAHNIAIRRAQMARRGW